MAESGSADQSPSNAPPQRVGGPGGMGYRGRGAPGLRGGPPRGRGGFIRGRQVVQLSSS